jgi:3-dehydroquinate dehydratase-2
LLRTSAAAGAAMAKILLLNGPNLNTLGEREPQLYGTTTLKDIEESVRKLVEPAGHSLVPYQSNVEGEMVSWLHANRPADFVLVNAAAYTHTSIALRDALKVMDCPFVEIHISNVYKREPFRHTSLLADAAVGAIVGLGALGYELAALYALDYLAKPK